MKASTFISTAALLGSVIAIFLAARHPQTAVQSDIDAQVDARIAARELKVVQALAPTVRDMLKGLDELGHGANWSPRTVEELLEPLVKVLTVIGESEPDKPTTEQSVTPNGSSPPSQKSTSPVRRSED